MTPTPTPVAPIRLPASRLRHFDDRCALCGLRGGPRRSMAPAGPDQWVLLCDDCLRTCTPRAGTPARRNGRERSGTA